MLEQENIDDLRIGPDGLVSDFNDVTDQLRLAGLRKAGGDMTLNVGHSYLRLLFQTSDQLFVVGIAFDELRQMLPVLHEVDASSLPDDKKDIVGGFARRFADHA